MAGLHFFLVLMLLISAGHKLVQRAQLTPVAAKLMRLPQHYGPALLLIAATTELLAALAMMIPDTCAGGAMAAAAIWTCYSLAMFRNRGSILDCGCDLVRREKPVGAFAILRPAVLAVSAVSVALTAPSGWTVDAPFAAVALLALWFSASELSALPFAKPFVKGVRS